MNFMFMWDDYKKQVFAFYEDKRTKGLLSSRLRQGSPAQLKKECLVILEERFQRKDARALMDFFEVADSTQNFKPKIAKFDIDKFRPLSKYIRNPSIKTDDKNIELLAWLIDFEPRPWEIFENKGVIIEQTKTTQLNTKEGDAPTAPIPAVVEEEGNEENASRVPPQTVTNPVPLPPQTVQTKRTFGDKKSIIASVVLLSIAVFIYWYIAIIPGQQACMYWNGERYVKIFCNEQIAETQVIALDTQLLRTFKRITTPDTITLKSIGNVWYSKQNNRLEYFTADGTHPTDRKQSLRPITEYIIIKYIHPATTK